MHTNSKIFLQFVSLNSLFLNIYIKSALHFRFEFRYIEFANGVLCVWSINTSGLVQVKSISPHRFVSNVGLAFPSKSLRSLIE